VVNVVSTHRVSECMRASGSKVKATARAGSADVRSCASVIRLTDAIMNADERELWRIGTISCVMISCCAGAELQVRDSGGAPEGEIVVRELYPSKSDLYERARALHAEYGQRPGA
jgi:hypothetical protein